ncbi:MAG: hypothetical protein JRE28_13825 [Deltaproteobacteria bacterium]|nr:hypothetical protein [Deltaproteobacteria bacterium]
MGAYIDKGWCACKSWKRAAGKRQKRQKLILGPKYRNELHDECMMAVVLGYNGPLLTKILAFSHPSEFEYIKELFAKKVDIEFSNGNLVISN